MNNQEAIAAIRELLLEAPLYKIFKREKAVLVYRILSGSNSQVGKVKLDGYCPYCKRAATFTLEGYSIPGYANSNDPASHLGHQRVQLVCARQDWHELDFWLRINSTEFSKIGQHPSLADIAISETRFKYAKVLKGDNWSELYKAIGLATHGEGIGSFVYLRRVLERLVQSRFEQFQMAEAWTDDQFAGLRMDEKVRFLKNHLPAHLVENRRIYGIFSKGIHELDNEQCLEFFEVGKQSIIMILEDDLKTLEALAARKMLTEAIAKFSPDPPEAKD